MRRRISVQAKMRTGKYTWGAGANRDGGSPVAGSAGVMLGGLGR